MLDTGIKATPEATERELMRARIDAALPALYDATVECRGAAASIQKLQCEVFRGPDDESTAYFVNNLHYRTVIACEALQQANCALLDAINDIAEVLYHAGLLDPDATH